MTKPNPRNYQSHFDSSLFARYHRDIYMPDNVYAGALGFLPPSSSSLILSSHYLDVMADRHLPKKLHMPSSSFDLDIVDVTVVRTTWAVYRVMIRTPWFWSKGRQARHDLCIVLEGDYSVVTAYWISRNDQHETLDGDLYEKEVVE
ncbi:hypothetical protein LCGC14_0311130 [marine sediment metagenome]|uniref:Uncharacterized protein n=1 Tax=marine sediment metagenome TaxID=412755 RepID=A0A0F9TME6_9ZZZZ